MGWDDQPGLTKSNLEIKIVIIIILKPYLGDQSGIRPESQLRRINLS